MLQAITSCEDAFAESERAALAELAEALQPHRGEIAHDWAQRVVRAFPEYFPAGGLLSTAHIEAIGNLFFGVIFERMSQGDIRGLTQTFYDMNRRLIDADFGSLVGHRLSLPELYRSARLGLLAIETRAQALPVRLALIHGRLSAHLMMLVGLAYSDSRAAGLQAAHEQLEEVVVTRTAELAREKALAETIIESLPGIFYMFDLDGRMLRWNRNFEAAAGRSPDAVATAHPLDFFAGSDRERVGERIAEVFRSGQSNVEAEFIASDGTRRPYFLTGCRVVVDKEVFLIGMGIDISERVAAEQELRRSRTAQMFAALLESAPDAMVVTDEDGMIVFANTRTEELFDYRRDQLLGRPLSLLVSERVHEGASRQSNPSVEAFGRRNGGARFPIEVMVSPLDTEDGRRITSAIRDITQRKLAEAEIYSLNATLERRVSERTEELARSNADLENFAYVVSHDLQEPLRAIGSYADLLGRRARDVLEDEHRHFLDRIVAGVGRMQDLLHDLLAYSRIGTRNPALLPTAADEVLREVLEDLEAAIVDAGAIVTHDPLPHVAADRPQLRQLLQNLIGNAIKFRRTEPPRVHLTAQPEAALWRFCVRDNGIGVPPEYAQRVFVIFQRLHSQRAYPGTGVGLAICKRIVERHGGRIWIESAESGAGTVVCFTLQSAPATVDADRER